MHERIKAARSNESGFTLIELLIVIVILGILAGVVIFASGGFQNKGALESCKTTVSSVKTATEAFHVDSATALYPKVWGDIDVNYFDSNGVTYAAPVVQGKGWKFKYTFDVTGVTPPVLTTGGGAAFTPADAFCTK